MQAVLLVGGYGTRLGPLTKKVPKPMVLIHGKPFLEYIVLLLGRHGVTRLHFCASHLGEQIRAYFGSGSRWNSHITYSFETEPMGTGGALGLAADYLEKSFLLINGDTYLPLDYRQLGQEFVSRGKTAMIVAYENRDGLMRGNIAVDSRSNVTCYRKNVSRADLTLVDAGVIVLNRKVIELIPPQKVVSFEEIIFPKLIESNQMAAFPTAMPFYDMGDPDGLRRIKEVLK